MRRPNALLAAPALLLLAAAPAKKPPATTTAPKALAVSPADAAAIRGLVSQIYANYKHIEMRPGVGAVNPNPARIGLAFDDLFTPSTRAIADENTRLLKGEMGDIGADIFIDAQDNGTVKLTSISLAQRPDGRVAATVVFDDAEMRVHGHRKTIVWERTSVGWRVHDVGLQGQGTYRTVMQAENKKLGGDARPASPRSNVSASSTSVSRRAGVPVASTIMLKANSALPANFRDGTLRFETPSKKSCVSLYSGLPGAAVATARTEGNWIDVAQYTIAANCGADIAYYMLGEAAEKIGYRSAALSYYQEASRIASTASFRFSEHCTLNKGRTGFQNAGPGCFGVPIEAASRDATIRMQAVAATEPPMPQTSAANGTSLGPIEYEGAIDAGFTTAQQQLQLQVGPQQIVGRLISQMGVLAGNVPVTGTYSNGRCVVQLRGGEDMVGTCDREVFTGNFVQRKTGKQLKKFWFATAARWAQGKPAEIFGNGEQPVPTGRIVTATGRARFLVERGGRCGPESMLLKGYCFDEAINELQRNPGKNDITVIAAHQPLPLGARIGRGEYDYVQVKRRKEGGFYADKDLHGYSKVQVPQGCMFRGAGNEGFIIDLAEGRKAAIEVTDYSCG